MPEWSFQRRLITGVILICVLAMLTSVASLFASGYLIRNTTAVSTDGGRDLSDARNLQLLGAQSIAEAGHCLLAGGPDCIADADARSLQISERVARMLGRTTDTSVRSGLDAVLVADLAHHQAVERALAVSAAPAGGADSRALGLAIERADDLERALSGLVTHLEAVRHVSVAPARLAVTRAENLMIGITVLTVLLLAIMCMILTGALNKSFRRQLTARNLAEEGQTEARASLLEVEAASHLKDEFLATLSHELRNPLAPILTWTQLLRSGSLDKEKSMRALEVIERNVLSQAQLIDDLVDVSRVVSGKFRLDVRPVDLAPVIRAAADAQLPAVEAKNIRLQLVLDERSGMISGDSERLQQVMWNLISNAIKFTPKGGRVQVVLQRVESQVEISVSDNGIGIEPEFLPHVFEPFRQATGGSMRRHGGLGLGLSIVRHIVELHGGDITGTSEGPGLGAKFVVKFPLLAMARSANDSPQRHPIARDSLPDLHLSRLEGVRALVVDDEPGASEALQVLFEACGAEARVAGSASEAMATFVDWRPDVLISDIAMPGEDGYSLIRRVRLLAPERGGMVPAVALTAHAKIEDRVTILAAGFQMYLSKPADPNELIAVVESLVKRREPANAGR